MISYKFVPKIIASFHDYDNIYLVTTYFKGKSLNFFREKIFNEKQLKFVSACVIQSLIYLRKAKIIHRDIMMKNIIMDDDKYFNLIDFSFSIDYLNKNNDKNKMITYNRVTPPEILNYSNYDYNSDYYRLGSVIYYLLFKIYPYTKKKKLNIIDIFINYTLIKNYSYSCIDFLNKLLISNYKKRIGFKNINELKNHSWFKGFNWKQLEKKQLISPFHFFKSEKAKLYCTKIKILMTMKNGYKKYSKQPFFLNLINKYNFINLFILKNISYLYINK